MKLQPDWFGDQHKKSEIIDFMDIDQIEEVPDTPERLITSRNNDGNSTGNHSNGSSSCRVIDKDYVNQKMRNEPKEKGKSVTFQGNRRLFVRPDNSSNSPGINLGNSSSSKNFVPSVENPHHDKGKTLCNSSSFVDLTEQNRRDHVFGLNNTIEVGTRFDRGKAVTVGAQHNEINSSSLASPQPRVNRHKRLVRNGCISPNNIAKSEQVADKHDISKVANMSSNGPSSTVDIKDLISEAKDSHRFKGKGVSHNLSFLEKPDARNKHLSRRSSVIFKEETDANKESEGWITTHNTMRKVDPALINVDQHLSRGKTTIEKRDHRNGSSSSNIYNHFEDLERDSIQHVSGPPNTMSHRAHNLGHFKERAQLTKRHREGVGPSNIREHDVAYFNDAGMASSSLNREPSTSRSTRNKNRRGAGSSDLVIAIDELSPEIGNQGSSWHPSSNEDSSVRALQLEADEMLARELQEQLYNEELETVFGIDEMDSHHVLATTMRQEHGSHASRAGGRPAFRPASRIPSASNLHQNSRSNASRNSSNNRGAHTLAPTSTRLARLRGRFPGRPRTLSSSRNSIFPPNMDVDMRMQILEALEAFNDMDLPNDMLAFNDMELPSDLLQLGREFNENDYEMLLALDENNHQHGGATNAQINNLPESTVQAGNLQECAICLETPNIGETIRHLPCLHKFHKDCIDEWLRRKTSCPVCKSSVT